MNKNENTSLDQKQSQSQNGILIEYSSHSKIFLLFPTKKISKEILLPEEITRLADQRDSHTRKKGQNGIKMNTDHTLWLKDKNTNRRVKFEKAGFIKLNSGNEESTVPAFMPTMITYHK